MKKELNEIIKKYELEKITQKEDFLLSCYDYKIYLENLKTNWYIKFEDKTKKCKFYSVYTRFENQEMFKELNKLIGSNAFCGKNNYFVYSLQDIEDIFYNITLINKNYKKAA